MEQRPHHDHPACPTQAQSGRQTCRSPPKSGFWSPTGYVERAADPHDGRAKIVRLTAHGLAALRAMRATALAVEQEWSTRLSPDGLSSLRELLLTLLGEDPGQTSRPAPGGSAGTGTPTSSRRDDT
ncbi:hypothetical protein FMEAI12_3910001 [Parafrankia sp. Ea1.12]|nr:hypothetical protein FMEAI12_3910001 [Parafrankia sp. Ea1.12]